MMNRPSHLLINIVFLRHAQTEYGMQNRLMGVLDIPCSKQGIEHARALGNSLGQTDYLRIYCSPLMRAVQTAEAVFPRSGITVDPCIVERNLGDWAGRKVEDIRRDYPNAFLASGHLDPFYTPRNGESIEDMTSRVKTFIDKVRDLHRAISLDSAANASCRIAVVTHNGVLRVIRCLIEDIQLSDMYNQREVYLAPIPYTYDGALWHPVHNSK